MKPSMILVLLAVLAVVVGLAFAWHRIVTEPTVGGVPASAYLAQVIQSRGFGSIDREKLLAVPYDVSIPILAAYAKARDPKWHGWYLIIYSRAPMALRNQLKPPQSNRALAWNAERALDTLGRDGAFTHERCRFLFDDAKDRDPNVRRIAARLLQHGTSFAAEACGMLMALAGDADASVIGPARGSLVALAQNPAVATQWRLAAMAKVLETGEPGQLWSMLIVCRQMGPGVPGAITNVIPLLTHRNERVRGKAVETLACFGTNAASTRPLLEPLRHDQWQFVSEAAEAALRTMSPSRP